MTAPIKNHTQILEKAFLHQVERVNDWTYRVISGTSGESYTIFFNLDRQDLPATCTCPRQQYVGKLRNGDQNFCSHVTAVIVHILAEDGYAITTVPAHVPTKKMKRREIKHGVGDNVKVLARKDVQSVRRLRKDNSDDRPYLERLASVVGLNAPLAGLEPEAALGLLV